MHETIQTFHNLYCIGLSQKISTHHLWTTLNWVPKNFRISKRDSNSLCRIPNTADSKSWVIPEFCEILNGFARIPIKIHKILGKFMEFQSGSPSTYCRIFSVVHGTGVDIFWNSPLLTIDLVNLVPVSAVNVRYRTF